MSNVAGDVGGDVAGGGISPLIFVAGAAIVLAGAGFIYYKFGGVSTTVTTKTTPATSEGTTSGNGTPSTPSAPVTQAKSTPNAKDFTNLPSAKSMYPNMPDTANGLSIGQDVTLRAGATVVRFDEGLNPQGSTTLTADTALGKVWQLWANDPHVTIRAKDSFSYPFYHVDSADVNKKGSTIAKVEGEVSTVATSAYDWFKGKLGISDTGFIGADGFGDK